MALLANKCVLLSLSAVLLCCLVGGASAMLSSLPPPPPMVNFTIGVQGVVWCKSCRYHGYFAPMDASPLPGNTVLQYRPILLLSVYSPLNFEDLFSSKFFCKT